MSGASGKVPAAIHVTPEAADGGPLAYVRTGDVVRLDALTGSLEIKVALNELMGRGRAAAPASGAGYGREMFGLMRRAAGPADAGACSLFEAA
jgi:phosphogluconate dehydratase